jgi:hypothetical protein
MTTEGKKLKELKRILTTEVTVAVFVRLYWYITKSIHTSSSNKIKGPTKHNALFFPGNSTKNVTAQNESFHLQ